MAQPLPRSLLLLSGATVETLGTKELHVTVVYLIIEVIAALALILLVLLHSGKGGGLSDMFGGSVGAAAQGSTVVEKNLDRITIVIALIFFFTTLTLDLRLQ